MRSAGFDREQTLEKITDAFWEHGYEATSIGVLEAATGLKRQSLYNAFGNKDAMFGLAVDHYERTVSAQLMRHLDNDDPLTALTGLFNAQADMLLDPDRPSGCLVAGGQQELGNRRAALGKRMDWLILEQHQALLVAFELWKESGRLWDDADPAMLASVVMSQIRGASIVARTSKGRTLTRQATQGITALFESYLR
ncbi:TetR/AcrR family transcriptional regulator [Erythrobacter sp.]|jgi:AcrR family transcriptional regulator|uniref:TetR/AcrR family transcriptional regulator n=1 Tax=Erythrobacter sp. TaxID=1042 RepID=UPI002ECE4D1C|nr:TetR/AcrR family transcriptional regulator [Erythrobacter sp.]